MFGCDVALVAVAVVDSPMRIFPLPAPVDDCCRVEELANDEFDDKLLPATDVLNVVAVVAVDAINATDPTNELH